MAGCWPGSLWPIEEYRGQGFARQAVTYLTRDIIQRGKTAYLYVDKANPISNHLYQSIGYKYDTPMTEAEYIPDRV